MPLARCPPLEAVCVFVSFTLLLVVGCQRNGSGPSGGGTVTAPRPEAAVEPESGGPTAPPGASLSPTASTPARTPVDLSNPRTDAEAPPRGKSPVPDSPAPGKHSYRVAIMGDSISDFGSHGGGFIRYLQEQCPQSEFDNYGKGGQMVNQMRRRFERDVLGPKKPAYTHVIIFGGVNDLHSDLTANRTNDRIQKDLSTMYLWARDAGVKVVAVTVTPWGGFRRYFNARRKENTRKLNAWIRAQQGQLVDTVVDAYSALSCGNPDFLCPEYMPPFKDGLHFGKQGHRVLGKELQQAVFSECL
jgi:lysophospholipase L1-like esterase